MHQYWPLFWTHYGKPYIDSILSILSYMHVIYENIRQYTSKGFLVRRSTLEIHEREFLRRRVNTRSSEKPKDSTQLNNAAVDRRGSVKMKDEERILP